MLARLFGCCFCCAVLAAGCMSRPESSPQAPPAAPVSLEVPPPTTYCEKVWSCSYEGLLHEEAKKAMVQKRKAFVSSCEEALRKMPGDFIQKYEHCAGKSCGEELRNCLLEAAPAPVLR